MPTSELPPEADENKSLLDGDSEFDWKRYYFLLLRRWWIIGLITVVVTSGVAGWVFRQPKIYTSSAVLQVEQEEKKVLKMDDLQNEKPDTADYLNTIAQALTNATVMTRIVDKLHLAQDRAFAPPKADGQPYSEAELTSMVQNRITASVRRNTRLIDVVAEDQSPIRARDLASAVVTEFLRQGFEQRLAVSKIAGDFLSDESRKLKDQLEASEKALQEYRETHQAVSLDQTQNIIVERLKELNTQVTKAKGERVGLESDLEQIRRLPKDDAASMLQIGSVAAIPEIADIRQQLVKAEANFAAIKDRYLYRHPKNIAAATQISELKVALLAALQTASSVLGRQYDAAKETEAKLTQALQEQEKAALDLNKIAIPYNVLTREVESDRAMYDAVITRFRETAITVGIERSPFRILEEPMITSRPAKPQKGKIIAMGLLVGLGLGLTVVFGFDFLDTSLRSVDHAEEILKLPSLATVPESPLKHGPMVLSNEPGSVQAESFRTLRTSLSLLGDESSRQIILFTSAIPAEGKSFTSVNAGIAFASENLKTLLIDADLRRPRLAEIVLDNRQEKPAGLTNYLSDLSPWRETLQKTQVENLFLLSAGERAPNPAELLASRKFQTLLTEALEEFDRIVIDTAPVNAVSDTLVIAKHAHFVCLVIRSHKTPAKAVQRAVRVLQKAKARIAGFVLNRSVSGVGAGYYYYQYGGEYTKDGVYGSARRTP